MEFLAGTQMEGPGRSVLGQLPALRDAGTDAAFLQIEPDQGIIHRRLVDRIARPSFQDRVQGLRAERFDGKDQRPLLRLGREGMAGERSEQECEGV